MTQQAIRVVKGFLNTLPTISSTKWDELFYIIPSVENDALGIARMKKDAITSYMSPVYFASRVMIATKKGYPWWNKWYCH